MSNEHLWPDWFADILADLHPEPMTRGRESDGGVLKAWETYKIDATVKRVCEPCNNVWMSALEAKTKSILEPMIRQPSVPRNLSPKDQEVLARWAYKTALVGDFSFTSVGRDAGHNPIPIPLSAYQRFFADRLPPSPGAVIWITAYDGLRAAEGGRFTQHISPETDPDTVAFSAYVTTILMCSVVFQITGHLRGNWRPHKIDPEASPWLGRIWPPTGDILTWPCGGVRLDDDMFTSFSMDGDR